MNEIIVGYLRVVLSVPPMTVLVVIVLVRVFKNELKTLMDRTYCLIRESNQS